MIQNRVKSKLEAGGRAFGASVSFTRNPGIVRIAAAAGYDFVFIDMEHAPLNHETVAVLCDMARAEGITPVVRPALKSAAEVNKVADLGAMGIMLSDVRTRAEVDNAIEGTYFPPIGKRGAYLGPIFDYRSDLGPEVASAANSAMLTIVQIESRIAVESISTILDGGGIDIIDIGRLDLSMSYGVPGDRTNPVLLAAIEKVLDACRDAKVAVGTTATSILEAEDLMARGMRCICYPSDMRMLMNGFTDGAQALAALDTKYPNN